MKYGIRMTGRKPDGQFYIDSVYIIFDNEEDARNRLERIYTSKTYPPHIEYTMVSGEDLEIYKVTDETYYTRAS